MFYSFARPLDVSLIFEDRTYNLGETINVTVQLTAGSGVKVRKGRIYLVYDVRWTEAETEGQPLGAMIRRGGGRSVARATFSIETGKQVERRQSYVLGGVGFLGNTQLERASANTYSIVLKIHDDDPPYSQIKGASIGWSIVAEVDVIRAFDAKTRRDLKVMVKQPYNHTITQH